MSSCIASPLTVNLQRACIPFLVIHFGVHIKLSEFELLFHLEGVDAWSPSGASDPRLLLVRGQGPPPPHLSSCIASDLTLNLQRACISFLVIHFGVHIRLSEFELLFHLEGVGAWTPVVPRIRGCSQSGAEDPPPPHLSSCIALDLTVNLQRVLAFLFSSFILVFTLGSPNLNSDFIWRGSVPGAQLLPWIRGSSQSGAMYHSVFLSPSFTDDSYKSDVVLVIAISEFPPRPKCLPGDYTTSA